MDERPNKKAPLPCAHKLGMHERIVSSADLLGDSRELHINHLGQRYTLRLTRFGKLILTK